MGEYWKPVNVTKRQMIHPHRFGDGLKLGEWFEGVDGSRLNTLTANAVGVLLVCGLWSDGDDIRVVSDYGGEIQWFGIPDNTINNCVPDVGVLYRGDVGGTWKDVSRVACRRMKVTYHPPLLDFSL